MKKHLPYGARALLRAMVNWRGKRAYHAELRRIRNNRNTNAQVRSVIDGIFERAVDIR